MLPRQYITVYADCRGFCSWTDHKMLSAHSHLIFDTLRGISITLVQRRPVRRLIEMNGIADMITFRSDVDTSVSDEINGLQKEIRHLAVYFDNITTGRSD